MTPATLADTATRPTDEAAVASPQQRMAWAEAQAGRAGRAVAMAIIDSAPDDAATASAAQGLVRQHALLRLRLTAQAGGDRPAQPAVGAGAPGSGQPVARMSLPDDVEQAWAQLLHQDVAAVFAHGHGRLRDGRWLCAVLLPATHADADTAAALLAALYPAPSPLGDPIAYRELATWWDGLLRDDERADGRAHWQALPRPADPPLPASTPPGAAWAAGGKARTVLAAGLRDALAARCGPHGVEAETWLLAVWAGLLRRVGGSAAAAPLPLWLRDGGREFEEIAEVLGPIARLLPLAVPARAPGAWSPRLPAWAEAVQAARRWASDFDPARCAALAPTLTGPACPLQFACYDAAVGAPAPLPGLPGLLQLRHADALAGHRLRLSAWLGDPQGIALELEADSGFESGYADQLLAQFVCALGATLDDPACPEDRWPLLDAAARQAVLTRFNLPPSARSASADGSEDKSEDVALRFARQAALTPERTAVIDAAGSWTYAQLERATAALAERLRASGMGAGARVGVCLGRSRALPLAVLAALRAGIAYVPLDPAQPPTRLAKVVAQAKPALILVDPTTVGVLPAGGAPVLEIDTAALATAVAPTGAPACAPNGATAPLRAAHSLLPAYAIFTSGSTGEPKGVVVPRGALANFVTAMTEAHPVDANDAVLGLTSLGFDIAILELLLPLVNGARLVLAPAGAALEPQALTMLIEQAGVTLVQATPATWRLLCESRWPATPAPLRVLCGGEALNPLLARALLERVPAVWNVYGPTETTVWSTAHRLTPQQPRPLVGRPLRNTRCHVLDDRLEPVPVGIVGELYIGGDGVALGYLDRPDLTAERFVPDPHGPAGGRLYRTGDLARYGVDGVLECLGRADDQIKIRGFRVEPGEIEAALVARGGVGQALVQLREDRPGQPRLVAYVTPAGEDSPAASGQPTYSLYYFGADSSDAAGGYDFYLRGAEFADANGLEAVWTPERHFHPVGGLYPNPAVLNAALAMRTRRVHLRAGSVVLPLHSPLRVAEEWAVVDQLSGGRVGMAIASGWHPRDFVLAPDHFEPASRHRAVAQGLRDLRALWRGETITQLDGAGQPVEVRVYPRPQQPELPLWITSAGHPQTIDQAGALGANLLTHLLGQTVETLAEKVAAYRDALARHGFDPASRRVTLMIHTYLGDTRETAVEAAREPFLDYMRAHLGLMESLVRSLGLDHTGLGPHDMENAIAFAFERYSRTAALIGAPQDAADVVVRLHAAGVDEVACLVDWMPAAQALPGLQRLPALRTAVAQHRRRPAVDALRAACVRVLPDYMVPSAFVVLDRMPLTPNGKVDRRALPAPVDMAAAATTFLPPRDGNERVLADIWSRVLRQERIGRKDHFFHLGGDSILAIRVIAQARDAGLQITPRELFLHPTLEALAATAVAARPDTAEQAPVDGGMPLMPIQRWFLELGLRTPHHFNQSILLAWREPPDLGALSAALHAVVTHHDALRLQFAQSGGGWRAHHRAPDSRFTLASVDVSNAPPAERANRLAAFADALQADADLAQGPLFRAAVVHWNSAAWRLLLVAHHLVVDGLSWRILVDALGLAYRQRVRGQPIVLPRKTHALRDWSTRLSQLAQEGAFEHEQPHWQAAAAAALALPEQAPVTDAAPGGFVRTVALDAEMTRALVGPASVAYRSRVDDLLLAALALVLGAWSGRSSVGFDLEAHGREDLFEGMNVSRTVGWFTVLYPVRLDLGSDAQPRRLLMSVKEQLRAIPRRGVGYGALRYLAREPSLQGGAGNAVCFNYLGQVDGQTDEQAVFALAAEARGAERDPNEVPPYAMEVNAVVVEGALRVSWGSRTDLVSPSRMERLADDFLLQLRRLVSHCLASTGGYTPSDFPLVDVRQDWLDALHARFDARGRAVEDVVALTPLQQGLLFHSLVDAGSGVYVQQMRSEYTAALDVAALRGALQAMVDRHAVLRGVVAWQGVPAPLMVVTAPEPIELAVHDWSALDAATAAARCVEFVADDRARGFGVAEAPLQRFSLLRVTPARWDFVWSCHHLLFDAWSLGELQRQFLSDYVALTEGRSPELVAVPPYRDYVEWLQRQDHAQAAPFWRARLADVEEPTPLPLAQHRDGCRGHATLHGGLDAAGTAALAGFVARHGLTLSTVVHGLWALLLARLGQQRTVVVGSTVAGRPAELPGVEAMVGLFLNSLPVRVDVDEDATIDGWLQALQGELAELRRHESTPLPQVQACSGLAAGTPLFESLVVIENFPVEQFLQEHGHRLPIRSMSVLAQTSYALTLTVTPGPTLSLSLAYDLARFDEAGVKQLLAWLCRLAAQLPDIAARPAARVRELELLSAAELQQLRQWNDTGSAAQPGQTVHGLVAEQAQRTPQAVALRWQEQAGQEQAWTYAELETRANRLAHELRSRGCGPGTRVGVCLPRTGELVVALLAVLRSGAAYVPLDPAYPAERIAWMAQDAQLALVLSNAHWSQLAPAGCAGLACAVDDAAYAMHPAHAPPNLAGSCGDRNLAYVIYTSGSTGRPKGVAIEHRSAVAMLHWAHQRFGAPALGGMLASTSVCFDLSVFELFAPLSTGGTVVLVDNALELARLAPSLQQALSFINTVPSAMTELLRQGTLPPAVQVVALAGEPLPDTLVRRIFERSQAQAVYNLYGPSEDTTYSTWDVVQRQAPREVCIGLPLQGTQAHVLDGRGRQLPVGVAGELYLGGEGLARGYLGRPDLTGERFVPDPFGQPGSRLYRTGDRVRWRADGRLEFLGRADHQIKLRGYRIELGEIEAVLRQRPGVQEALAMVRDDTAAGPRLLAWVVPQEGPAEGQALDAASLRQQLQRSLPGYMVPAAIVVLAAFPLTPNGKIDRAALPGPQGNPAAAQSLPQAMDATQQRIAAIWQDLLGVPRVGLHDNFFDLGGHSLLMLRAHGRLVELGGGAASLELVDLFVHPTVAALAKRLNAGDVAAEPGPGAGPDAASRIRDVAARQRAAQQRQRQKQLKDRDASTA